MLLWTDWNGSRLLFDSDGLIHSSHRVQLARTHPIPGASSAYPNYSLDTELLATASVMAEWTVRLMRTPTDPSRASVVRPLLSTSICPLRRAFFSNLVEYDCPSPADVAEGTETGKGSPPVTAASPLPFGPSRRLGRRRDTVRMYSTLHRSKNSRLRRWDDRRRTLVRLPAAVRPLVDQGGSTMWLASHVTHFSRDSPQPRD